MKDNTKKTVKYYLKNMGNYKLLSFSLCFLIITGSVLESIIPIYFKNFFNVLTENQPKDILTVSLFSILLVISVLKLLKWFFWRVAFFILNFYESKIMTDLSKECFSYLHYHSFAYFSNSFTGSIVKKVKSFIGAFEVLADQFFYQLLPSFIKISIIIIVLAKINIYLGLGILVWIILFLLINWIFTKYKLKFDIQRSEAETATSSFLADTVTNNANIKLFNGYKKENNSFSNLADNLHKVRVFAWELGSGFYGLQSLLLVFLEVGIFYFAIKLWSRDVITVGDFVLIQTYIIFVMSMVWDFGKIIMKIYEKLAEAEEMTVILNIPHEIVDTKNASDLKVKFGKINFNNVGFAYEEDESIIDDFSLEIKAKETVALIGTSGAGKTTLTKLLLRMFEIQKGKILIDGQDISQVTQESLRNNISLVPQDPILFHRSLMENIRYGKFDATDEEVIRAAKLAHCDEFISKLHFGYDTFVGERGIKLSGGERQRVAIARAILRNAPILVLDEATSSLDSESERFIQESLDALMKNKTVIIIAHRLSTIKKADRIVVIDNKKIVEEGIHEKLIKQEKGVYKRLWNIQVGGFIK
ncbi:MAG: ABC transporter ATP-binding protein [Candidatus Shapirobacteria bacterium]|jgi:ATP-binding cassette subfamily B protein